MHVHTPACLWTWEQSCLLCLLLTGEPKSLSFQCPAQLLRFWARLEMKHCIAVHSTSLSSPLNSGGMGRRIKLVKCILQLYNYFLCLRGSGLAATGIQAKSMKRCTLEIKEIIFRKICIFLWWLLQTRRRVLQLGLCWSFAFMALQGSLYSQL